MLKDDYFIDYKAKARLKVANKKAKLAAAEEKEAGEVA